MNKFLQNLGQQENQLPVTTRQATEPVATEYDPIKRLTDELSRQSRAIEGLSVKIDRIEKRPQAATQTEVQALVQEAQEGVNYTLNSEGIARLLLPDLQQGLPSPKAMKAAADAGVSAITAAGTATAEQIKQAGATTASLIEGASRSQADKWANTLGFMNWRSALLVGLLPLAVGGISLYKWSSTDTQLSAAQTRVEELQRTKQEWITFGKWVAVNFPDQWKTYNEPTYAPTDAYLKKVKPKQ
jgi:uncharacterized phage infection (PIP) family protein YhgE